VPFIAGAFDSQSSVLQLEFSSPFGAFLAPSGLFKLTGLIAENHKTEPASIDADTQMLFDCVPDGPYSDPEATATYTGPAGLVQFANGATIQPGQTFPLFLTQVGQHPVLDKRRANRR
jgi:hypothetical protein